MPNNRKFADKLSLWGLVLFTCIAIVLMWVSKKYGGHRELGPHPRMCHTNLRGISASLMLYGAEYNGAVPPAFDVLVDKGFASGKMFICPGYSENFSQQEDYRKPDYVYAISGFSPSGEGLDAMQLFELPVNHNQAKAYYLTGGCSISSEESSNFSNYTSLIQKTNDYIAKKRNMEKQ